MNKSKSNIQCTLTYTPRQQVAEAVHTPTIIDACLQHIQRMICAFASFDMTLLHQINLLQVSCLTAMYLQDFRQSVVPAH